MFKINHKLLVIMLLFLCSILVNSCKTLKDYKWTDSRKVPVNVDDRVRKNIAEGRGIKLGGIKNEGFSFATSNELWKASIEILNFLPLTTADYGGGIIITDWYSKGTSNNESIKITIRFLSDEIRADVIIIYIHKKICNNLNQCTVTKVQSNLEEELKLAILSKAAFYKNENIAKKSKEFKKKKSHRYGGTQDQ